MLSSNKLKYIITQLILVKLQEHKRMARTETSRVDMLYCVLIIWS